VKFLGIDLGGTKAAFRLAGDSGRPRQATVLWPPGMDAAADLAAISGALDRLLAGCDRRSLSVGVAVPATLDKSGRVLQWPSRPSWQGVDLLGYFARDLPDAPIRLADDGDLAAIGEAEEAEGRDLLYIGVGTGVGGGLFLNGQLFRSRHGAAAEIGHIVVAPNGPVCRCGRRGCLQAIASGPATLRRAAQGAEDFSDARALRAGLAADAPGPARAVLETARALATAIVTVDELLHPPLVRLGGGFAHHVPELEHEVTSAVRALDRPGHHGPMIEPAVHGSHSSLMGAVLLARHPGLLDAA
jgi:kanosamine 6-kinase